MNLKKGEIYVCIEPYCGAEIEVIRGAHSICRGEFDLRCCCGKEMVRKETLEELEHAATAHAGSGSKR